MDPLTNFSTFPFESGGKERTVYRQGTGPAVLISDEGCDRSLFPASGAGEP
jgi:hypothetical protein